MSSSPRAPAAEKGQHTFKYNWDGIWTIIPPKQKFILSLAFGVLLRIFLFNHPFDFPTVFSRRVEISTPLIGFRHVKETAYMLKNEVPIYEYGDSLPAPLLVVLMSRLIKWSLNRSSFIAIDIISAIYIFLLAKKKIGDSSLCLDRMNTFLFNPLIFATCIAQSCSSLTSLSIVALIYHAIEGNSCAAMLWCSIGVYLNMHPLNLLPCLLVVLHKDKKTTFLNALVFVTSLTGLLYLSALYVGGWSFIGSTYGSRFFFSNLVPNVGIYWYLFMQVFDFFRPLFTNFLQTISLFYGIPIAIYFREDPLFMLAIAAIIQNFLQPYPTIADLGLSFSLVLLFPELAQFLRLGLLSILTILYAGILAPVAWHFWAHRGFGNANYYYAVTLAYNAAQAIFIYDLMRAWIWRRVLLSNPSVKYEEIHQA